MVSTAVCICAWSSGKARSDDPTSERGGHKVILASGLPVMVSQGLASIASYLPILVLTRVSDPTFVGIFASAAYLLTFANLVGSSTQTIVLTPFRSTKEEAGSVALLARARKLAARMVLGGILSTVAVVGFGGRVLTSIYGEAFWLSPFQLFLLSLSAAAIPPAFMFSAVLSVLNAFRVEVWIWLVSCVVGLLSGLAMSTVNLSAIVVGVSVSAVVFLSRLGGVVLFAHAEVRSRVEPNDDDHHVRGL